MRHGKKDKISIKILSLIVFLGLFCVACATTHQVRSVSRSGFLEDYEQLNEGKKGQALMVYIDKNTNFSLYDKIIIQPVRLIVSEDSAMAKISKEDSQAIADYLYLVLSQQLAKNYTIVTEPGPKTMELRVALTDMASSKVVMDTLSSLVPIGMAVNLISKVATGNNISVGSATAELELLDSTTGKRLSAAIDGRSGSKYTGKLDKWGKWNHTKDACDQWAGRLATRLDELRDASYLLKGDQE